MNISCGMICCELFVYHCLYGLIKSFHGAQFVLVVSKLVCFYSILLRLHNALNCQLMNSDPESEQMIIGFTCDTVLFLRGCT